MQTLHSLVSIRLTCAMNGTQFSDENARLLSSVINSIGYALEQRACDDHIFVQYFEGNTARCNQCIVCNVMPYDYIGVLHYLDYFAEDGEIPYLNDFLDKFCDFIISKQSKTTGMWPSLDMPFYPDDPLASAGYLTTLIRHDFVKYSVAIQAGIKALMKARSYDGTWSRPTVTDPNKHMACTKPFPKITIHRCVEAIMLSNEADEFIEVTRKHLLNSQPTAENAVGFLSDVKVLTTSEISGQCHWLQAAIKSGVSTEHKAVLNAVKTILKSQGSKGAFDYNTADETDTISDSSDITAFAIQSLCVFLKEAKNSVS